MSCLFHSLAYFVKTDSADLIRQKVCNFLALNRPLSHADATSYVLWETQKPLDQYVREMRHSGTWGGAIEIQAFCELYGFSVRCIDQRTQRSFTYVPLNKLFQRRITVLWQGASHYEPLRQ